MIDNNIESKKKKLLVYTTRFQPLLTVSFYMEYQNVNSFINIENLE
jgi:hypothetical protein